MESAISEPAHTMAIDWVRRDTDHNEVAKVATYLHRHLRADDFFQFLEILAADSDCLERSNRTARHYQDIHDVCNQHLTAYWHGSLERTREMSQILGWAVRLMRYYRGVGVPEVERVAQTPSAIGVTLQDRVAVQSDAPPASGSEARVVGVTKKREIVTLREDAKKGKATVETADGEAVVCLRLPAYPPARKGMRCRAEVTRDGGVVQSAVFRRWE